MKAETQITLPPVGNAFENSTSMLEIERSDDELLFAVSGPSMIFADARSSPCWQVALPDRLRDG
jgi:hypothetical protein